MCRLIEKFKMIAIAILLIKYKDTHIRITKIQYARKIVIAHAKGE